MEKILNIEEFFEQHIQKGINNTHSNYLDVALKFNNEKNKRFLICRKTLPALKQTAMMLMVSLMKKYHRYQLYSHMVHHINY